MNHTLTAMTPFIWLYKDAGKEAKRGKEWSYNCRSEQETPPGLVQQMQRTGRHAMAIANNGSIYHDF
ncbi:hypothetical protein N7453_007221 [Penicillium expansum]|nr:hypothetical protein N7453_007221 [Penicillium expansum]